MQTPLYGLIKPFRSCRFLPLQTPLQPFSPLSSQYSGHVHLFRGLNHQKPFSPLETDSPILLPEICFLWLLARVAPLHPLWHKWNVTFSRNISSHLTGSCCWFITLCLFSPYSNLEICVCVCIYIYHHCCSGYYSYYLVKYKLQGKSLSALVTAQCLSLYYVLCSVPVL